MKYIRALSNFILVLSIVVLSYSYFTQKGIFASTAGKSQVKYHNEKESRIGGDFSLINQDGQVVNSRDFKDKYMAVFFGFSSCKRICPMNLGIISEVLGGLDEKVHSRLQTFFITVDPERDNASKLKEFQQQFDRRIQMLTGNKREIDAVMAKYKVYASKVGGEEDINHSSIVYLIGPGGKYVTHFIADLNSGENQSDKILDKIKQYIN